MARGRKKEDKFDSLPPGFKESVEAMSTEAVRKRISDIALMQVIDAEDLKNNDEVQMAAERLKNLKEPYNLNKKSFKLQIEWCKLVLDNANGGATSASAQETVKASMNAPEEDGDPDDTDIESDAKVHGSIAR
jgi:hypothetical protein